MSAARLRRLSLQQGLDSTGCYTEIDLMVLFFIRIKLPSNFVLQKRDLKCGGISDFLFQICEVLTRRV